METVIKLKPSELNENIFLYLKNIISNTYIKEITINLNDNLPVKQLRKESSKNVQQRIENAVKEFNTGSQNFVSFTPQEFENYSRSLLKK